MKISRGIIAVIITCAAVIVIPAFLGTWVGEHFASDIPSDDNAAPSCMWSDAVLDVDDFMLEHRDAAAEFYLKVKEEGEESAKADFLSQLYSEKVSDKCGAYAWAWMKQAYLKFETPGHTSMDAGWLNDD